MQTITINGISYSLVTMPATPGPAEVEFGRSDLVSLYQSPYTRQQQTQQWPGADWWDARITLPPQNAVTAASARAWHAFLAELRGSLNVFQLSDPTRRHPLGNTAGSNPKVDTSGTNLATNVTLGTVGWAVNQHGVLLPGDLFQLGYRLHEVCEAVNSDEAGAATITIWPSLREAPAAGEALVLSCPKGLFRLPQGRRSFQASPQRLTTMSFDAIEVR